MKYNISKEFFPFSRFSPPISKGFLKIAVPFMKTPKFVFRDKDIEARTYKIKSYDGKEIECYYFAPRELSGKAPCLIYLHGGGFVMEAAEYHFRNCFRYARELGCRIIFPKYRLAPENPHPVFFEDCYAAMDWAYNNADDLGIDTGRIGIGGDSAGSTLSVGVIMMARDRNHLIRFRFQMLPYPFLDARSNSESCKKFTDTPMWNSRLSEKIAPMTRVDKSRPDYVYYSPVEADSFEGMPPAYIETAEFDCLHDDGILYAYKLSEAGVPVTLYETKSTMHGFDIVQRSDITRRVIDVRIGFMKQML